MVLRLDGDVVSVTYLRISGDGWLHNLTLEAVQLVPGHNVVDVRSTLSGVVLHPEVMLELVVIALRSVP